MTAERMKGVIYNEYDEYSDINIYGRRFKDSYPIKLKDCGNYFMIPSDLDPEKDKDVIKVVCISDTHNSHYQLDSYPMPSGDILINAGDFTDVGRLKDIKSYDSWIDNLINKEKKYKYHVLIAGNHDITLEKDWYQKVGYKRFHHGKKEDIDKCNEIIRNNKNIIYLEDAGIKLFGLNIYGSPYQPEFCNWAFNLKRGELLQNVWKKIPTNEQIDILLTHTPPKFQNDKTSSGRWVGCDDLMEKIFEIKNIKYHIFGHIHNSFGVSKNNKLETAFVNASTLDSDYKCTNKPIMFYIKGDRLADNGNKNKSSGNKDDKDEDESKSNNDCTVM